MMDHHREGRWPMRSSDYSQEEGSSLGSGHQQGHHHRDQGYQHPSYVREGVQSRRWAPLSTSRMSEEEKNNQTYKRVRGILNKLTPEKFDKLSSDLIMMRLNSPPILKGVILLIHDKALEEPKYSSMYAQLCKKLSREIPAIQQEPSSSKTSFQPQSSSGTASPGPASDNMFCKFLLIRCQEEFDNRLKASERFKDIVAERQQRQQTSPSKASDSNGNTSSPSSSSKKSSSMTASSRLSEEEEEQRNIAKSKMLGNIKFIAELGRHGLIPEGIIHKCIVQLLSRRSSEPIASKSDDLECLCQIMKTVGRQLDSNDKARKLCDQYFQQIKVYSTNTELPSRIRFMLQDVIELRDNQWLPRRVQKDLGPRTINQVREEAARDLGIPNPLYYDLSVSGTALQLQGVFGNNHGPGLATLPGSMGPFGSLPHSLGRTGPPLPLYGHPALALVGSHGQRALDDMGYYANSHSNVPFLSGPPTDQGFLDRGGNNRSSRGSGDGKHHQDNREPQHIRGHMPYRGSSSQDDPRNSDQSKQQQHPDNKPRSQRPEHQQPRQIPIQSREQQSRQPRDQGYSSSVQRRDFEGRGDTRGRNNNLTCLGGPGSGPGMIPPPRLQNRPPMMQQQQPYQQQYPQQQQQHHDRQHDRHEGRSQQQPYQQHPSRGGPGSMTGPRAPVSHSVVSNSQHQRNTPQHIMNAHNFPFPSSSLKQDISLRPAENSMVVLRPTTHFAPKAGSLSDTASQLQKQPQQQPQPQKKVQTEEKKSLQVNQKEVFLKKVESILDEMTKPADAVNEDDVVVEESVKEKNTTSKSSPSIDDITLKMKQLKIPSNYCADTVEVVIRSTLNKTDKDRQNASDLLIKLKKEGVGITNSVFITAVKRLLSNLKSLEVDDPLVKTHLSEFVARAVSPDILSLTDSLEVVHSHYPMFLLILQQLSHLKGKEWLSSSIESHKINLMSILPEVDRNKEQLCDILENRGLSFLMPLLRIESDLKTLLVKEETSSPATILKWIKDNVDPSLVSTKGFVIMLFSCIFEVIVKKSDHSLEGSSAEQDKKQAEVEKEAIKSFSKLLKAFVFDKPSLQLTALYALQTLCHQLKFPKGMLLRWFNCLYDLEVIDDEVFLTWKEDINDDFPGKGQALFQVNTWLIWLEEEEAEDSDEEDQEHEDNNGIDHNDN